MLITGGKPLPLKGASNNGKSNFFPRFSPDGKWIVFTQTKTGLVNQPGSELFIIPAEGGTAKKLHCNTSCNDTFYNSWHSWSPNGRWLVFTSKTFSPFTELFITHISEVGESSPPVRLHRLTKGRIQGIFSVPALTFPARDPNKPAVSQEGIRTCKWTN